MDDLRRLDSFDSTVSPSFYDEYGRHADSAAWLHYAYMAEEYRLSLFAPSLALKGRASAKKLHEAWDQLTGVRQAEASGF